MNQNVFLAITILALISPSSFAKGQKTNSHSPSVATQDTQKDHKEHMDAIAIILQDHKQIRQMIAELNKHLSSDVAKSRSLFKELKDFLIKHETMEQKVWYPELEKQADLKDIISALKKEEQAAGDELKALDGITDDKEWVSGVKKLNKNVEHHAREEETKLFPKVKKSFDKSALEQLGAKLKDYKSQH